MKAISLPEHEFPDRNHPVILQYAQFLIGKVFMKFQFHILKDPYGFFLKLNENTKTFQGPGLALRTI